MSAVVGLESVHPFGTRVIRLLAVKVCALGARVFEAVGLEVVRLGSS